MSLVPLETAESRDLPWYQPIGNECELFLHAWRNRLPLLLKGPTGCGKTRFVQHMCARIHRPLYTVACHDDLSAADLLGRHLIGAQETYWQDGPLTRAVREGAVCYLDEVVEARKDTTVVLHPLTDDRRILPLDRTGETLHAPAEFMLVVSYNPGYQNLLKQLKPSTRQRFVAVSLDFPDSELEQRIVAHESGCALNIAQRLVQVAARLRNLKTHDLEEVASTRLLIYAGSLVASGLPIADACEATLVEPLTDDPQTAAALREIVRMVFEI